MKVGAITHPVALEHDAGRLHPERRQRLEAIRAHLDESGLGPRLEWTEAETAPRGLLELVHEPAYLDLLERSDRAGGAQLDPDTRMGPGSFEAARRASQAAVDGVRRVLEGSWDSAFVLMRPPGHHATPDAGMGFCLLNHAAVAARWAVTEGGAPGVLVLDWDAHHGNGTQDVFWRERSVLYASLHQYPFYPGTGALTDVGAGAGEGTTVNVPMPAGAGEDAYTAAFEEVILPEARAFEPALTIVSAGYDAHGRDPLCMMRLTAGAYYRFTRRLEGLGRGPVCVLEGGYDLEGLAWSVGATLSAMIGEEIPSSVPPEERDAATGDPQAQQWVERAAALWRGRRGRRAASG